MSTPVRVAVTGAAGQIGYALLFRIASGQLLGDDTPVQLSLLEIPDAVKAAEGTAMELDDCAFPLLAGIDIHDDPPRRSTAPTCACWWARGPARKGMERADLLEANGGIFKPQGEAIAAGAADDVKVLVVGNPANTNALIAMSNADGVPSERFTAMTRLDQNRARTQLAKKAGAAVGDVTKLAVWGNHSPTMYPDVFNAQVAGGDAWQAVGQDQDWLEYDFIPTVGKRGAAIIEARGASSAASAANAAIDHVHDWVLGTPEGDWVSMAVPTAGNPYGVEEGLISSFPCTCSGGEWSIVEGLELSDFSREKIDATTPSSLEERDAVEGARPGLAAVGGGARQAGCQPFPRFLTLPSFCRLGHYAVEVVGLDAHRVGQLGDGDAGLCAHQLLCLERPLAAAARAAAAAGARAPAPAVAAGRAARGARRARVPTHAGECGGRLLEPLVLVDQRLQLLQA